ncbi:GGDEF domain-containing protein [Tsukamurella sp. 1534]|uniref:GGDEF domain-containing protein n=1 Tax=Tsukamurella sp. 1534 TaxID=1151061 RepID=UPI00131F21C0|nr:GGDEF domain-containing protein [Tsukamurella sp. 1534]
MADMSAGRSGSAHAPLRWMHAGPDYQARIGYLASRRLLRGFRIAIALTSLALGAAAAALIVADPGGGASVTVIRSAGAAIGLFWCVRWFTGPPPALPAAAAFVLTCCLSIVLVSTTQESAGTGAVGAMAIVLTATFAASVLPVAASLAHATIAISAIVYFAPRLLTESGMLTTVTDIGILVIVTVVLPGIVYVGMALMSQDAVAADTDGLCGTLNRRGFYRLSSSRITRYQRRRPRLCHVGIIMIDHDGFKTVNDVHGHVAGDATLLETAEMIGYATAAAEAYVGRLGGDEFAVLAFCDHSGEIVDLAERIRHVANESSTPPGERRRCTLSIGVSHEAITAASLPQLLLRADAAMYRAKLTGNAVVVYEA